MGLAGRRPAIALTLLSCHLFPNGAGRDRMRSFRRILVLTGDHGLPDATKRDARYNAEDMAAHEAMRRAFAGLPGYDFSFLSDHASLRDRIESDSPDLVVNFCDTGFRNVAEHELHVPAYLELLGIPYTGAPPAAMAICYDKAIVRLVAREAGVAVPAEVFIARDASEYSLPNLYPALIKPNTADGSVGITKDAVVRDAAAARAYLAWLRRTLPGQDALMQEYLPGPEYGVGLIGNPEGTLTVLPPLEVDFSRLPAGLDPILSYESKAHPESPYWTEIKFKRAALDPPVEAAMAAAAKALFRRLGLRDYGRFDFRRAADGTVRLMEVNPNPAWANDGKLAFMAGFAGIAYPDMLRMILEAAIARVRASEEAA
jgi:D-alanine-D-alanine ligase